jgi:hypothetical protein
MILYLPIEIKISHFLRFLKQPMKNKNVIFLLLLCLLWFEKYVANNFGCINIYIYILFED